ncbi:MAG TPA: hypothetical protein VFP91_11845 [Vicinamibacterales bacterium]|nr:hypothetical protein [Vicinamibacterales bacterium]
MRIVASVFAIAILASTPAFAQNDLSGEWANLLHEDVNHRNDAIGGGPRVGDYAGLPINDAARARADAWDAAIYTLPEHQTIFAPAQYWARGGGGMRIQKVVDEATQQLIAYKIYRSAAGAGITRMIWMDGRPHPPEYAAHTWQGFSTGRWEGAMLTVKTTHVKEGWIQRNGVPSSDLATVTEHIVRHGDVLTIVSIVEDPIYLEEPLIRSTNWRENLQQQLDGVVSESVDEIAGRDRGYVPHHLPGTNKWLKDAAKEFGIPESALRGGRETTYPEYRPK